MDDLIFFGERIVLFLGNTVPETDVIFRKLQEEPRLSKYNVKKISEFSPLSQSFNTNICELLNVIGRYDADTQIKYTQEFLESCKDLKRQYQEQYNTHSRLYIVFSISVGTLVSLMLI
ncbi:MAG: hypothetical protein ACI4V4_08445 [Eubacterium sp.]